LHFLALFSCVKYGPMLNCSWGDAMESNFLITGIKRVILVGKDEYPEKTTVFHNNLQSNELIFHFSGTSTVEFNGKVMDITPNTIRFLPKVKNWEYTVLRKERGECIDVAFDTDRPISQEAFTMKCAKSDAVGGLFKKLFSVWVGKGEGYYFECLSLLYKIFAEISKQSYLPEKQYQAIKPAIDYIEEHFLENGISVEKLTSLCGISHSYLKKLFLEKYGMPPSRYIIGLKINYACDLLQSGLYNITQTAERCGYTDIYFFSRQFKAYMGVAPSAFVANYKSSK